MQPFFFVNSQPPIGNPASSKALTKLKNDKFIQAKQPPFHPGQPVINYQGAGIRQAVSFNSSMDSSLNRNQSPVPNQGMPLRRQQSNYSGLSASQTSHSQLSHSERLQVSNAYTQQASPSQPIQTLQHQPSQPILNFPRNDSLAQAPLKPLSAFNQTNMISSTNGDTRMRSSSASQFSLNPNALAVNQKETQTRIQNLEGKLNDYSQQLVQSNTKLSEKDSKITEIEKQLMMLRNRNADLEIKLKQYTERTPLNQNKLNQLEAENEKIKSAKLQIELQNQKNMQKVMTLQSNLDKILQSKNLQIQSLTQSCAELSKNVQQLHEKYPEQIRKLNDTIHEQEITIRHNKTYFQSMNERMKQLENSSTDRQQDLQMFTKKMSDQKNQIEILQLENKNLKVQLSSYIEQLQIVRQNFFAERDQNLGNKQILEKATADYNNAKKIGQQQIQFLQGKVEEAALQKQRLIEQIQLTKAITIKRNMIFQRKVIYDLKAQNDKLWAKLIDKSQVNANLIQNDPAYWARRYTSSHSRRSSHIQQPPTQQSGFYKQKTNYQDLEEQYRKFVEHLQQQQQKAKQIIKDIKINQVKNRHEDVQFYKNKCINLQKIVEQHLKINISLKQQMEKSQIKSAMPAEVPTQAEIIFLRNELNQQQILNQTLQRSLQLFKSQYQLKFKAAQNKVDEIQKQQDNSYSNTEQLKKQLQEAQFQVLRLANENFAYKNRIQQSPSQETKYQNLYLQLLNRIEKMPLVSQFKFKQEQNQQNPLYEQLQHVKAQLQKKQEQYSILTDANRRNCQAYEHQLVIKDRELQMLKQDFDKLIREYDNAKNKQNQLIRDISKLENQMMTYSRTLSNSGHHGSRVRDQSINLYYVSILRSKLMELDAFLKQLKQIHYNPPRNLPFKPIPEMIELIENSERLLEHCLSTCSQLEGTGKVAP